MGLLHKENGFVAKTPQDAGQLQAAGYQRCYTNDWKKVNGLYVPCPFWLSPETISMVQNSMGGYYSCPVCNKSYDLMHDLTWHGVAPDEAEANQREDMQGEQWLAGGTTRIGMTLAQQGQIGEDIVAGLDTLGEYGPLTWVHEGGATSNSPLDAATKDWGVEIKTIGYDATHHRFVPGGRRPRGDGTFLDEKAEKNQHAIDMGKKGVLGVLVMVDYRRSVADIYVREYPSEVGVGSFRTKNGMHLIKEVPFKNPLMDPHSPEPHAHAGVSAFSGAQPGSQEDLGW